MIYLPDCFPDFFNKEKKLHSNITSALLLDWSLENS